MGNGTTVAESSSLRRFTHAPNTQWPRMRLHPKVFPGPGTSLRSPYCCGSGALSCSACDSACSAAFSCSVSSWAASVSGAGGGTSEAVVPVSGAFGRPPVPCFWGQVLHAAVQLFLEVVAHVLQVFDGDSHLLARAAVTLLAGLDAGIDSLAGIGCVGQPGDDIAGGEVTFLAVGHNRNIVRHDKGAPRRIECRRRFVVRGLRSLRLSIV